MHFNLSVNVDAHIHRFSLIHTGAVFNFVELVRMPDGVHAIIEKLPTELFLAEASRWFDSCVGTDNM